MVATGTSQRPLEVRACYGSLPPQAPCSAGQFHDRVAGAAAPEACQASWLEQASQPSIPTQGFESCWPEDTDSPPVLDRQGPFQFGVALPTACPLGTANTSEACQVISSFPTPTHR